MIVCVACGLVATLTTILASMPTNVDNKKVMIKVHKSLKRLLRRILSKKNRSLLVICLSGVVLIGIALYSSAMSKRIDPAAYTTLLTTIAEGESRGNYNAYFGNSANTSLKLTEMSIAEVQAWQDKYVADGNASNAVGRYQIISPTLKGLIKELKLKPSQVFSERIQDKMAITLMERRGAVDFVNDKISAEQFAANLSQEWAALPAILGNRPTESFYAGDGLNEARISTEVVLKAVREFKEVAKQ